MNLGTTKNILPLGGNVKTKIGSVASNATNKGITFAKENPGMFMTILVILLVGGILVLYGFWKDYSQYSENNVYLHRGTKLATTAQKIPGNQVIMSADQKFGLEFSYSFWLWIDSRTYSNNNGKPKHILHKGSANAIPNMAPGVWLDGEKNDLKVYMNTTKNQLEVCTVPNVPLQKWVHVAIVLMGRHLDIYFNGQFKKRCTFEGIPIQNYGDVYLNAFNGFEGFLSQVRYFRYALPFYRLEQIFHDGPDQAPCVDTGEMPPYFSSNYFLSNVSGGTAQIYVGGGSGSS